MIKDGRFEWQETIKWNIILLRLIGLYPKQYEVYKLDFYSLYAAFSIGLFIVSGVLCEALNIFFILNDLQALTNSICTMLTKLVAVFKTYYFVKNIAVFKQLMRTLDGDPFQPRSQHQIKLIVPTLRMCKVAFAAFGSTCVGAIIFLAIYPIMDQFYIEHRFPFLAWYPFKTNYSPVYEITYVYQVVCVSYIGIVNVDIDTLIDALNAYIATQFEILADDLRNLHEVSNGTTVEQKLAACVEHHKQVLSFAETSNNFFNWIIIAQFFTSAVAIGLTMFQMTVVVPFSTEFYSLVFYETGILVQIFMFCWFGNEVQVKSDSLPYSVFESDWVNFSMQTKKSIIFFIQKSQRTVKISALNLFYLSLETFLKILKTAYSYFAFMSQVNSQQVSP